MAIRYNRRGRGQEQGRAVVAAEAQVRRDLRHGDRSDPGSLGVEHDDAVVGGRPDVAVHVDPDAVRRTLSGFEPREHAAVLQQVATAVVGADDRLVARRARDVQHPLVRVERQAVRLVQVGRHGSQVLAIRSAPEHPVVAVLAHTRVPLTRLGDAVGRVREPDAAVPRDHDVVRGVEAAPVPHVDDRRDDAVAVTLDPTQAVRALHDAAIPIERAAVGELDTVRVHRGLPRVGVPLQDPVAGDVGPPQRARRRDPAGPLGPGAAGGDALERVAVRHEVVEQHGFSFERGAHPTFVRPRPPPRCVVARPSRSRRSPGRAGSTPRPRGS